MHRLVGGIFNVSAPGGDPKFEAILEAPKRSDSHIEVFINGVKVNAGTDANPTEGYICLQTEAAEMFVRRYELWPLGKFDEKWTDADKKGKK